jgi:hypothetical protein
VRASTDYLDSLIAAGTASVPPERPAEEPQPTEAKAVAAETDAENPIEAEDPATVTSYVTHMGLPHFRDALIYAR